VAIRYHFDLYPRDDPKDGARLVRFTKLQSAEYRGEANGTGAGKLSLRSTTTDAGFIDPEGNQYVRVVREDDSVVDGATLSGFSELVVGGFWLTDGDYEALSTQQTQLLTFSGPGTLGYLERAVLWSHSYLELAKPGGGTISGSDPFDDIWRLDQQWDQYGYSGDVADAPSLIGMLWRSLNEAQSFDAANPDGDDRLANALPDLTYDFDWTRDSSNALATDWPGEFRPSVGDTLLSVVASLMQSGLYVSMDPDTFVLSAWEKANHGRDRTGLAWGSSVIRFQAPTDGTIDTGNIKSNAVRGIVARIKRSILLAGGQDVYGTATEGAAIPWEGFYPSDAAESAANATIAAAQVDAINDAGDTARLRFKLGKVPTSGTYRPFEEILLDDSVTVHTGTGDWDWNEAAKPVSALTIILRTGGDWDAFADLGSTYRTIEQRRFQAGGASRHIHPPNPRLCEAAVIVSTNVVCGTDRADIKASGEGVAPRELAADCDGDTAWGSNAFPVAGQHWAADLGSVQALDSWRIIQAAGATSAATDVTVYGTSDSAKWTALTGQGPNYDFAAAGWTVVASLSGLGIVDNSGSLSGTFQYWAFRATAGGVNDWAVYEFELGTSSGSSVNDGHADLVGTSNRAARCDHRHDVHRDTAPTVDDDWATAGYKLGTIWAQLDSLVTPTEIVGTWMLVDASTGAAVWLAMGGGADSGFHLPWFVVTDYGATGDGTTDDTVAIQDAIDAAAAAGGGVVYFPAGVYVVAGALQDTGGANSQLTLPSIDYMDTEQVTIVFRGAHPPPPIMSVIGATPIPDGHSIIKGTLNAGTGSLLGGYNASGLDGFTNVYFVSRDLTYRMPANPVLSGLDLAQVAGVDFDNVVVDAGSYHVTGLAEPTTATSFGVRFPTLNNGANSHVGVLNVVGFYKGVEHGEHLNAEQVNIWGCKQALVPVASYHASYIQRLMTVHCERGIVPTGRAYLHVDQYNIEHAGSGWWITDYDIDDASDYLYGSAEWKVTLANVGHDSTFTVNGATNFEYWEMGQTPGGVSDHGALTGLADDDHAQYLNAARHTATDHSDVTETAGYWSPLTNGDTTTPELVFAAGDTITVWTET
jgi:hypothetical protein